LPSSGNWCPTAWTLPSKSAPPRLEDLVFGRTGQRFQLAVEAAIPESLRRNMAKPDWDTTRYEVSVAVQPEIGLESERLTLFKREPRPRIQLEAFPRDVAPRSSILGRAGRKDIRTIVAKAPGGNDRFNSETHPKTGKGWITAYKLGPHRSALGNLPEDESKFPVATWLKGLLVTGVQRLVLDSLLMLAPVRYPRVWIHANGSNLPW
jgi:hypothetical protein